MCGDGGADGAGATYSRGVTAAVAAWVAAAEAGHRFALLVCLVDVQRQQWPLVPLISSDHTAKRGCARNVTTGNTYTGAWQQSPAPPVHADWHQHHMGGACPRCEVLGGRESVQLGAWQVTAA